MIDHQDGPVASRYLLAHYAMAVDGECRAVGAGHGHRHAGLGRMQADIGSMELLLQITISGSSSVA